MFSEISRFRGFEVSRFRVIHLHLLLLHFNITISWFTQVANFEYSLRLQGTLSNFQAVCTLICNVQRVIINFASICRCIGRCLDRWRMSLDRHETQHSEDPAYPLLHVAFTHRTMWVFFWLFSRHLLSPLSSLLPSSSFHFGRDLNRAAPSSVSSHGWSRANTKELRLQKETGLFEFDVYECSRF